MRFKTFSFKNTNKKQTTELANYIWDLKATSRDYKINGKYYAGQIQYLILNLVADFVTYKNRN